MVRARSLLLCSALIMVTLLLPAAAYPSPNSYYQYEGQSDPEELMDMLNRLGNLVRMERKMESFNKDDITSEKRGGYLDLGLGRGYSGTIQAKHLLGQYAANYPGGPGRRR